MENNQDLNKSFRESNYDCCLCKEIINDEKYDNFIYKDNMHYLHKNCNLHNNLIKVNKNNKNTVFINSLYDSEGDISSGILPINYNKQLPLSNNSNNYINFDSLSNNHIKNNKYNNTFFTNSINKNNCYTKYIGNNNITCNINLINSNNQQYLQLGTPYATKIHYGASSNTDCINFSSKSSNIIDINDSFCCLNNNFFFRKLTRTFCETTKEEENKIKENIICYYNKNIDNNNNYYDWKKR